MPLASLAVAVFVVEVSLFSSRDQNTQNAAKWPHQQNGALRAQVLQVILQRFTLFRSRDENIEISSNKT